MIGGRRLALAAHAFAGLIGLSLLAAACGGSPRSRVAQLDSITTGTGTTSTTTTASTPREAALAFSHCMRSHGVSKFPDPSTGGTIPKVGLQQLGVSSARLQAAQGACRHLLPNGGAGPNAAQRRQARAQALSYAECVRIHGVPNFPDPGSDGRIPDPATVGIDQGSPKFEAANQACSKYRPPYVPSNAAYNVWARQHG